jgi:hypothetical protein
MEESEPKMGGEDISKSAVISLHHSIPNQVEHHPYNGDYSNENKHFHT